MHQNNSRGVRNDKSDTFYEVAGLVQMISPPPPCPPNLFLVPSFIYFFVINSFLNSKRTHEIQAKIKRVGVKKIAPSIL